jgi:hypothetical protein
VHTQEINEYPEDIKAEFLRVSEWIRAARKRHGNRILIRLVDPQSLGGMWKVLRNRIRRYPTFFVDRVEWVVGWEGDPDGAVNRALSRQTAIASESSRP